MTSKSMLEANARLIRVVAASVFLALAPTPGHTDEQAYNPRPAKDDVILPMPGGYKMVFVRVPIPGTGYWGAADRVFEMGGDPKKPEPFEVARTVRIGGNFRTAAGKWYLAFGKYEVTIGQYAAVMGNGDLAKGLAMAAELSGIEELATAGESESAGRKWLARPLHGMSMHDYHDFITRYNVWCLANADCLGTMKRELGGVGFLRLPTELEWEYVARGGEAGMRQTAPFPFPQSEIANFAHVDSRKTLPDEIGKRNPLPGLAIYDIYGNVAELMANPFTMDNGFGSVGAGVIRGGDYTMAANKLRFSYREELAPFRLRTADNVYVPSRNKLVGIRLMIGSVVKDTDDRGQKLRDIEQEFRCCYRPVLGSAGGGGIRQAHIAGRTLASAKDLGALAPKKDIEVADAIDAEQPAGYFSFHLDAFGTLKLDVSEATGDLIVEIRHGAWDQPVELSVKAGTTATREFPKLLPGIMWARFYSPRRAETVDYRMRLRFEPVDIAGNVPSQAHDIGVLTSEQVTIEDYVGYGDMVDYFKFRIERPGNISIRLLELTGDADVELLSENQTKLAASVNPRTAHEEIDYPNAKPGTYFIRVYSKDKTPAAYKLMLALGAVDTAGDTFEAARNLGTLDTGTITIRENLSAVDQRDYFKLTLSKLSQITVQVSKMTSDVRLSLFDSARTALEWDRRTGTAAKSLDTARPPGEYFILVENATNQSTPYYMTIEVRPSSQYCHYDLAYSLNPEAGVAQFDTSVSDACGNRWAKFELESARSTRVSLNLTRADRDTAVLLKLFRVGASNTPIELIQFGVGHSHEVRRLEAGDYMVRLDRVKGTSADIRLALATSSGMFDPEPQGTVVREFDDWVVRVDNSGSKKNCMAYTVAKSVSPDGWRGERPYLFLSLTHRVTKTLAHGFDFVRFYDRHGPLRATVKIGSGSTTIPIMIESPEKSVIQTLEPCGRAERCISTRGLQGLSSGGLLTLEGRTAENRPASVTYSLRGYQPAIRHAASLCDVSSIGQMLSTRAGGGTSGGGRLR
jgi:formylglycine-generating enzyme required for sulfatase activity